MLCGGLKRPLLCSNIYLYFLLPYFIFIDTIKIYLFINNNLENEYFIQARAGNPK